MPSVQLTDAYVKSAKCVAEKPYVEVRDAEQSGLELRIMKSGRKVWRLHYTRRSDGKRRAASLGSYPAISLKEARRRAKEHQAAIEDPNQFADPATLRSERNAAPTFAELATEWTENHATHSRSERVRADDAAMLKRFILPDVGPLKAADISRRDITAMLARTRDAIDSRKGRIKPDQPPRRLSVRPNRVFELIRAIFRWALSQGIVEHDPTAGMKRPVKKEPARDRALSIEEIKMFWDNLDRIPTTAALKLAIRLSLVTGQRIDEVCGMAKSELMLDGVAPVWMLPRERTKNAEPHRVPLSPLAVDLIRTALALQRARRPNDVSAIESPFVFPARAKRDKSHGPIRGAAASVAMFRGRDKLQVEHFTIHDLRRTAATRMAEMGIAPHTISLILNHTSTMRGNVTSAVYVKYSYDAEKRAALNAWSDRLREIFKQSRSAAA